MGTGRSRVESNEVGKGREGSEERGHRREDAQSAEGVRGQPSPITTLAPAGQITFSPAHPPLLLAHDHSGSKDCTSPLLCTLCLQITTVPQTSHISATHTSKFSNKCSFKEFPSIYTG